MTADAGCSSAWSRRVSFYHDGGLSPEDRAEVEAHIHTCAMCQAQVASYDRLFRRLRSLPGFEGMLTITRPGARRGRGATQRPTFTWPGGLGSGTDRPGGGLSNAVVALFLTFLLLITLAAGHGVLASMLPTSHSLSVVPPGSVTPTPVPVLQLQTPNGTTCANVGTQSPPTYTYLTKNNSVFFVTSCNNPISLAKLPAGAMTLGAWSPDNKLIAVLGQPAGASQQMLYTLDGSTGSLHRVESGSGGNASPVSAEEAVWISVTKMIVSAQGSLAIVDVSAQTVTSMNITKVTHMVWRGSVLFYSVVEQGKVALHRHDLTTGTDTVVIVMDVCGTAPGCPASRAWDISADGAHVAYAVASSTPNETDLVYQSLSGSQSARVLETLPAASVSSLAFSPDSLLVAALFASSPAQPSSLSVVNTSGAKLLAKDKVSSFTWRFDSKALIYDQASVAGAQAPTITLLNTTQLLTYLLEPNTQSYVWAGA